MLGLRFCASALSSCGKRGPPPITVRGPPTVAASLAAEHRLQTRRPSNCGSRAQPLRGTRNTPRPGPEPVSPALAGRLPTTVPPGRPQSHFLLTLLFLTLPLKSFSLFIVLLICLSYLPLSSHLSLSCFRASLSISCTVCCKTSYLVFPPPI